MKERPILFSAPMVRAILDGRKSQTRRVMKPQPPPECGIHFMLGNESWLPEEDKAPLRHHWEAWGGELYRVRPKNHMCGIFTVRCPFGAPGALLWVREVHWRWGKWVRNGFTKGGRQRWKFVPVGTGLRYMENRPKTTAKRDGECGWVYRHSRFMFRIHSRITLEITDVRVQRVQEISEGDALAEGAMEWWNSLTRAAQEQMYSGGRGPCGAFHDLWDSINGKTHPWANNDWVWAVSFRRLA